MGLDGLWSGLAEVLVGKTLEQSMMEVLEEEELASLQRRRRDALGCGMHFKHFQTVHFKLCIASRHQEDFEKRRNAELLEVPNPPGILLLRLKDSLNGIPLRIPLRML